MKFRWRESFAVALAWRYAAHAAMVALALWNERRPAPPLPDLVLGWVPRVDWIERHNFQLWLLAYVPVAVALLVRDRAAGVRMLWVGGWLSLLRGVTIPLTGLGPIDAPDVNAGASFETLRAAWLAIVNPVSRSPPTRRRSGSPRTTSSRATWRARSCSGSTAAAAASSRRSRWRATSSSRRPFSWPTSTTRSTWWGRGRRRSRSTSWPSAASRSAVRRRLRLRRTRRAVDGPTALQRRDGWRVTGSDVVVRQREAALAVYHVGGRDDRRAPPSSRARSRVASCRPSRASGSPRRSRRGVASARATVDAVAGELDLGELLQQRIASFWLTGLSSATSTRPEADLCARRRARARRGRRVARMAAVAKRARAGRSQPRTSSQRGAPGPTGGRQAGPAARLAPAISCSAPATRAVHAGIDQARPRRTASPRRRRAALPRARRPPSATRPSRAPDLVSDAPVGGVVVDDARGSSDSTRGDLFARRRAARAAAVNQKVEPWPSSLDDRPGSSRWRLIAARPSRRTCAWSRRRPA